MMVLATGPLASGAKEDGQESSGKPPGRERGMQDGGHFKDWGRGLDEGKVSLRLPTFCE